MVAVTTTAKPVVSGEIYTPSVEYTIFHIDGVYYMVVNDQMFKIGLELPAAYNKKRAVIVAGSSEISGECLAIAKDESMSKNDRIKKLTIRGWVGR